LISVESQTDLSTDHSVTANLCWFDDLCCHRRVPGCFTTELLVLVTTKLFANLFANPFGEQRTGSPLSLACHMSQEREQGHCANLFLPFSFCCNMQIILLRSCCLTQQHQNSKTLSAQ
jgi:hypothetical protein